MKYTYPVLILILSALLLLAVFKCPTGEGQPTIMGTGQLEAKPTPEIDSRNATFSLDGETVTLVNGVAESPATSTVATKSTVRYYGYEAYGDLNFDGQEDGVFLVEKTSGSETVYYAVAAILTDEGYKTTGAYWLGGEITPLLVKIMSDTGKIKIEYTRRQTGELEQGASVDYNTFLLKVTSDGNLEGV